MIYKSEEFYKHWGLFEEVFFLNKRFPQNIFKYKFSNYTFIQFNETMTQEFWDEIRSWNSKNTKEILIAVVEPDPVEYYFREFNCYNMIKLSKTSSYSEYLQRLFEEPPNSPADSIFSNSFVIGWLSDSLEWAIWGERSLEFCIIGSNDPLPTPKTKLDTMDINDILGIVEYEIGRNIVHPHFFETFRKNYDKPRKN
ncbi:hypothetical protein [Leptospira kirschneri]|uniref:hypothetical protein n=2 Tax=Leptospiraceae TaxID=170 RepID=UPI0009E2AFEB|nr:hypothetical protein [Leptospira kirschneri]